MHTLTIAHSPDPDDVFMWWPLGDERDEPAFDTAPFRFAPLAEDIQVLNRRAIERGDLDITAISIHTYPAIRGAYRLTDCAGSFGEGYGPKVVVRAGAAPPAGTPELQRWLQDPQRVFAVPGINTTAYLALGLMIGRAFQSRAYAFDAIARVVAEGEADAGLLIHDAQLTFSRLGLEEAADLGAWWGSENRLPLPLGGNVVRRDLDARFGPGSLARVGTLLARSVRWALEHRAEGIERISPRYPDLDRRTLDRYLSMYVSGLTVSAGETGRVAIQSLLERGWRAGLGADPGTIDLLGS